MDYTRADLERVWPTIEPKIRRFLKGNGVPESDLPDQIQETYIRAAGGIETHKLKSNLEGWILGSIARTTLKAWRRQCLGESQSSLELPQPFDGPLNKTHRQELLQILNGEEAVKQSFVASLDGALDLYRQFSPFFEPLSEVRRKLTRRAFGKLGPTGTNLLADAQGREEPDLESVTDEQIQAAINQTYCMRKRTTRERCRILVELVHAYYYRSYRRPPGLSRSYVDALAYILALAGVSGNVIKQAEELALEAAERLGDFH